MPRKALRLHLLDPPAYTPPYDHALAAALARAGAEVELFTSVFQHGEIAPGSGYAVRETFYRWAPGSPGSRLRRGARLAQHPPDMLRYALSARVADIVHFQWLPLQQVDVRLLPRGRPLVLTAHDVLPREPRRGQVAGQRRLYERMDAVVVHSEHGASRLRDEVRLEPARIHVIAHGAFLRAARAPADSPLPPELASPAGPVVLCFGLMRPYKGIDVLLEAWRALERPLGAELWVVGLPRMDLTALRAAAPPDVRWVPRFVSDGELAAVFRRADLAALPYREIDQSGVLFTALAFELPIVLSAVGGFGELDATGAVELVAPKDPGALADSLSSLLADPGRRARMSRAAQVAVSPDGAYGWDATARRHMELYTELLDRRA